MKIANVRFDFAANSSSTHSIIFARDAKTLNSLKDKDVDGDFGWGDFVCKSKEAKQLYLAQTLYENLKSQIGHDAAQALCSEWLGQHAMGDGYVDHQSLMIIPRNITTGHISGEFIKQWRDWYLRDIVVIIGGNDNDDSVRGDKEHILPTDERQADWWCRPDGEWWTLFNNRSGTKVRISFSENPAPFEKSYAPELVDVKITDFCPFGCKYCFQDSTTSGQSADPDYVHSLIRNLGEMGVFEIAFGGGEPTADPNFLDYIKCCVDYRIKPNFTTFHTGWMRDPELVALVKENCGRFAVSVNSSSKVYQAYEDAKKHGLQDRISFHYVLGTASEFDLKYIIEACGSKYVPLVILGYKTTGRGSEFKPQKNNKWLEYAAASKCRIGIDTALAQAEQERLQPFIDKRLVTVYEGKFSCYIDAVAKQIAPSSYCDKSEFKSIDMLFDYTTKRNFILEWYQTF